MSNNLFYFTGDGSYGVADKDFRLFDTSKWTEYDWALIEECSDSERAATAAQIAEDRRVPGQPFMISPSEA